MKALSSRSRALPGNACREAPPPLLGTGASANKEDFYRKLLSEMNYSDAR